MAKQGARAPLAALLLRLCVVGLLAAAPALSSRAAVDASYDKPVHGPGRWLAMRTLLQVPVSNLPYVLHSSLRLVPADLPFLLACRLSVRFVFALLAFLELSLIHI